eukprot:m.111985 g.111985  ORF g.111985 m.111985 type:complete len:672 (-) comp14077_c0_seq1:14-2029(-)
MSSTIKEVWCTNYHKRRDTPNAPRFGGLKKDTTTKYYQYEMKVTYSDGRVERVFRRYSQFDALRETMYNILGPGVTLPKLTGKFNRIVAKGFGRSSIHQVAEYRKPKLQRFIQALLAMDDTRATNTLVFFLTSTEQDKVFRTLMPETNTPPSDSALDDHDDTDIEDEDVLNVIVQFDFQGTNDTELTVKKGDVLHVRDKINNDWIDVEASDGHRGLVPANYVLPENEDSAPSPTIKNAREELVLSEKVFVEELKDVKDNFFPRLRGIISAPEAKTLFGNWAELIPLGEGLLADLNTNHNTGLVLQKHLPKMTDPYAKYCGRIKSAQDLYEAKLKDKKFSQFEESFTNLNKPTLNHIMRPVQRIMKYPLLIGEILKTESEGSDVYKSLDKAMSSALKLAGDVNADVGESKPTGAVLEISQPDSKSVKHVMGSNNALIHRPPPPPDELIPIYLSRKELLAGEVQHWFRAYQYLLVTGSKAFEVTEKTQTRTRTNMKSLRAMWENQTMKKQKSMKGKSGGKSKLTDTHDFRENNLETSQKKQTTRNQPSTLADIIVQQSPTNKLKSPEKGGKPKKVLFGSRRSERSEKPTTPQNSMTAAISKELAKKGSSDLRTVPKSSIREKNTSLGSTHYPAPVAPPLNKTTNPSPSATKKLPPKPAIAVKPAHLSKLVNNK